MRAPFSYLGGKSRLAPWIVSFLPPHRTYVEPFAGSGAVLFAKPQSKTEILNDLDGNVVAYYRVLRDRELGAELVRQLRLTPYAREEFELADLDDPDLGDLERARRFFIRVMCSMNHSTTRTGFAIAPQSAPGGGGADHARKFVSVVDRLELCAERLRTVMIERLPAVQVIAKFGANEHTVLYCDPPYLATTRSMATKRPLAGDYGIEYASPEDHKELAEVLHRARASVLLSGYPSPLYEELYGDWHRVERRVDVAMSNGNGARARTAVEVLWSNRPLRTQGAFTW
jgi:DNA adenine methylase